jgi:hypothetical protein
VGGGFFSKFSYQIRSCQKRVGDKKQKEHRVFEIRVFLFQEPLTWLVQTKKTPQNAKFFCSKKYFSHSIPKSI